MSIKEMLSHIILTNELKEEFSQRPLLQLVSFKNFAKFFASKSQSSRKACISKLNYSVHMTSLMIMILSFPFIQIYFLLYRKLKRISETLQGTSNKRVTVLQVYVTELNKGGN